MRKYPIIVSQLVNCFDGWLVGGSAFETGPKDYDVVIDPGNWNKVAQMIPKDAKVNSFGGWKFKDEGGVEVDVWPETLNSLMTNHFVKNLYHPRSNTAIQIVRS